MNYPLKTIIVEDKPDDLELLSFLLSEFNNVFSIRKKCSDFESARSFILNEQQPFDVSFLDVELGDRNCYELISQVGIMQLGIIVFSTRFEEGPFKHTAGKGNFLYLSKPYSSEQLAGFIQELKDEVVRRNAALAIDVLPRLAIASVGKSTILSQDEIIYIELEKGICTFHHLDNGKKTVLKGTAGISLAKYEEQLDTRLFYRLSGNYLIAERYIREVTAESVLLKWGNSEKDQFRILFRKEGAKKDLLTRFLKIFQK